MIPETLMAIVGAGGSALVGAVATDAWTSARAGLARLFAKAGKREETTARWLDEMASELERPELTDRAAAERRWAQTWQQRLHDLVEEHPELAEDVRRWAETVHADLPAERRSTITTYVARDRARQYNAPGGSITVHHHPGAGSARE